MADILVIYRSPLQVRLETVVAYLAGILAVAALRTYTELPHAATAVALVGSFLLVPILNAWRLRHFGVMLPAAEARKRRSQDISRQSGIVSFVAYACGFMILVGTIILIMPTGSILNSVNELLNEPWLLVLLAGAGCCVAWRQVRRERRFVESDGIKVTSLSERVSKWRAAFNIFAGVSVAMGILAGVGFSLYPNSAHPFFGLSPAVIATISVGAGLLGGLIVFSFVHLGMRSTQMPKGNGFAINLGHAVVMGALFWGVPMAVFFAVLEIGAVLVTSPITTASKLLTIGSFAGKSLIVGLLIQCQLLSLTVGMAIIGGIVFGLMLGPFLWAAMRLSIQSNRGQQINK